MHDSNSSSLFCMIRRSNSPLAKSSNPIRLNSHLSLSQALSPATIMQIDSTSNPTKLAVTELL